MRILITGGSGFLGRALSERLQRDGARVAWASRDPSRRAPDGIEVLGYEGLSPSQYFDAVVNLAGAGIAERRWSDRRRQLLFDSRLGPTRSLMQWMRRCERRPTVLLSGSAVGWYGAQGGDTQLTEDSGAHEDFPHTLCQVWEEAAMQAVPLGVPVLLLRTGVVLDPAGGMLRRLLPSFRLGLGGRLGSGAQVLSWIALADWAETVRILLRRHVGGAGDAPVGPVNLTSPEPASNAEFTHALGSALGRPTALTVPTPLLKLALGKMSTLLLDGQRVIPQRLQQAGFQFRHPRLLPYLQSALQS
ncbi:TIGR01777 family oxidoreductase [Luteimonas sp. A277]